MYKVVINIRYYILYSTKIPSYNSEFIYINKSIYYKDLIISIMIYNVNRYTNSIKCDSL